MIVTTMEGDVAPTNCVSDNGKSCEHKSDCFCYPLWGKLDKAINDVLETTSLQDLIDWKNEEKEK